MGTPDLYRVDLLPNGQVPSNNLSLQVDQMAKSYQQPPTNGNSRNAIKNYRHSNVTFEHGTGSANVKNYRYSLDVSE